MWIFIIMGQKYNVKVIITKINHKKIKTKTFKFYCLKFVTYIRMS